MAKTETNGYRIDYFVHDQKIADATAPFALEEAVLMARRGLARNRAHYARIVDPARAHKLVTLVHRDVLP